ncbi:DUF7537 family lipoprotein, partial [Halarchaeum acidiphilum]|uniref:DUF7537 family lipoprotein n=2 Tax=Halarchaeum acidiphilum TaxID=489138 RepID=UPI0006775AB1
MRHTETIAALCLVALVALAGCSAISGPGNGSGNTTTNAADKPYQTPLNGTQIDRQHASILRDAGSFTYQTHTTANYANGTASQSVTIKSDLDSGAHLLRVAQGPQDSQVYEGPNGTAYTRLAVGNRTSYINGSLRRVDPTALVSPGVANATERANFTYNGTTTADGTTLYTYVGHPSTLNLANASALGNVSSAANITVQLGITADGLVQQRRYHIDTSRTSLDATISYAAVGSTDPTPAWLNEARQRFANQSASNETATTTTSNA